VQKKIKRRSDCPISYALDIFGDKWSLLIIRDIMFQGKKTYGEFLVSDEKIATNILADRLALLECAEIIKKKNDLEKKTRIIYSLTEKGIDLVPIILEIVSWSARYDKKTAAPAEFVARVRTDRDKFVKEIISNLRTNGRKNLKNE